MVDVWLGQDRFLVAKVSCGDGQGNIICIPWKKNDISKKYMHEIESYCRNWTVDSILFDTVYVVHFLRM